MSWKNLFVIFSFLFLIVVGGCMSAESSGVSATQVERSQISTVQMNSSAEDGFIFKRKTSSGNVTVDLTPAKFESGKLYVSADINTHTVDLDQYDLMEMTVLSYNGKSISPSSAPELSGHHNSGTFVFQLDERPEKFAIRITGLASIQEREFTWP